MAAQTPPQQSAAVAQLSPAGRQLGIAGAQFPMVHGPPQQSAAVAQLSAAGWQSGITGAQLPMVHAPSQQSAATAHGLAAGAHAGPPQSPPVQPRPQHPPARAQA